MRRLPFIIALLLGMLHKPLQADVHFRAAAVAAIRDVAPEVSEHQVQLLAIPLLKVELKRIRIAETRFDPALGRWQLRLNCIPNAACVPTIAVVQSPNKNLFLRPSAGLRSSPLVRSGERKQMSGVFGKMTIRMNVVCLQPGRAGDEIRVREPDGTRIFLAAVDSDGSLALRRTR